MKVELWVALIVGVVPLLVGVVGYLLNRRNINKKADSDEISSIVDDTEKIREIYSKSLTELEERWKKKFEEQEKENGENIGRLRQRLEDEARQQQGILLVRIDDLKYQIANLDGYVQGVTGDIYKPRKGFEKK